MADKKLVATTVSSRETGLNRRADTVTTSRPEDEKTEKQYQKKTEFIYLFTSKDSKKIFFTGSKEDKKDKKNSRQKQK